MNRFRHHVLKVGELSFFGIWFQVSKSGVGVESNRRSEVSGAMRSKVCHGFRGWSF